MMAPLNSFTDESVMSPHGEPIEYIPSFTRPLGNVEVKDISMQEFLEARRAVAMARALEAQGEIS